MTFEIKIANKRLAINDQNIADTIVKDFAIKHVFRKEGKSNRAKEIVYFAHI